MPEHVPCVSLDVVFTALSFLELPFALGGESPLLCTFFITYFAFSPLLLYSLLNPGYVWVYSSSVILVFTEKISDHKCLKVILLVDNNLAQNYERHEIYDHPKFYAKKRTPRPYFLSIK